MIWFVIGVFALLFIAIVQYQKGKHVAYTESAREVIEKAFPKPKMETSKQMLKTRKERNAILPARPRVEIVNKDCTGLYNIKKSRYSFFKSKGLYEH